MKVSELMKKPEAWFVALLMYLLLIFILSHMSPKQLPAILFPNWDKIVHFIEYLPVGFLLAGALYSKFPRSRSKYIVPVVAVIATLLGGLDEFHQSFVPGRDVSLGDALADILGAFVGAMITAQLMKTVYKAETTEDL